MQLQDPRIGYMPLQNDSIESIPLQPMHGSPYHVYPVNNFTAVRAFQGPHSSIHSISGSPLMSTASQMTMETPLLRTNDSPHIPRIDSLGSNRRKSIPMQETSFTNQIDTNAVVSKIQTMFPTAGENHIRLLLKKYYNREAVVISALQVEKHPLCTPGPYTTPPIQRHLFNQSNSAFQLTPPTHRLDYYSRSGSPMPSSSSFRPSNIKNGLIGHLYGSPKIGEQIRNSPKPHSSPKMKLRYMKNIFPKADETLLLDVLANSDNNVQKASEKLSAMGYTKRDVPIMPNPHKIESDKKNKKDNKQAEKIIPLHPKELTEEEKENIKVHLQEKYPKITERIVSMALESVGYSEDRANQILQIVQQEDDDRAKKEAHAKDVNKIAIKDNEKSNASLKERNSSSSSNDVEKDAVYQQEFQSILGRISTLGHNKELSNGPNENLLLADYVTWSGANPNLTIANKTKSKGSDAKNLRCERVNPHGSNTDLCKGPKIGLAKGSIYSSLNANIKCN
ncbi:uncharacterized protein LOC129606851 isoform X2 [Condylostylus longicornis]|nr:uncharacterized protein LOC129606851 isoform X2 [Condylostylus longicornis]XP_055373421.1 uncharacterized protein LOC129606851 isoform X2 [Condylostylus longicornis]